MLRKISDERRKARALFPKGSIAQHKSTRKLYRVGDFTFRSDCLEVQDVETGEETRIWWRKLEQPHPLVALAAEDDSRNEAEAA